ncbi:MAG: hypothetical protein AAF555_05935 [Verrucomicrobiota bacterium]
MTPNSSEEPDPQSLVEQPTGRVLRLQPDWEKWLSLLPKLSSSAYVVRGRGAIFCRCERFPTVEFHGDQARSCSGDRGLTLNLAHWSEAWWYQEQRNGRLFPCIEFADSLGRGILKVCYPSAREAKRDLSTIEDLSLYEGNEWDILHLRRSNVMDCEFCRDGCKKNRYTDDVCEILSESASRSAELHFIVPNEGAVVWDTIRATQPGGTGCWVCLSGVGRYLHLQPASYQKAEVIDGGPRSVASFTDMEGSPALTLIESDGCRLKSMASLAKRLYS